MTEADSRTLRSCLVCRKRADKADMLRLCIDADGQVWPDVLQKAPGRGGYVCWQGQCLSRMQQRQFGRAWKGKTIAEGQADVLRERAMQAVLQYCRQGLGRLRGDLGIGRDAVMHRMWEKTPLLVLLAVNAGAALRRQVEDACTKRQASGLNTTLVIFGDSATLGALVEREVVSVLALDDLPRTAGLRQYCLRYGQLRETE